MKNSKNRNNNNYNNKREPVSSPGKVLFFLAIAVVLILLVIALLLFLKQKKENESTVAEQGSEFEQIVEAAKERTESLDTLQFYEIDGDRYEAGSVLADFLGNGWKVAGSPDDEGWTYSESDMVEGQASVLVFLEKENGEAIQVSLLNTESSEKPYAECIINGFDVDESLDRNVETVTINGTEIGSLTVEEANQTFDNQSEDAGQCFYYFNVPEEQKTQGGMTMTGWSVFAGSGSGAGVIDWISFTLDYQYE